MMGWGMNMISAWMPFVILFLVLVIAVAVWLVMRGLNQKNISPPMYTPPPQEHPNRPYRQGYQSQRSEEPAPKSEEQVMYPGQEEEQPRAQYPQSQEMPPQR